MKNRLFITSCIALVATSMTFAIRANLMKPLGEAFSLSNHDLGIVTGTAFWGFTLSMLIGGALCDVIGMKKVVYMAFFGHLAGITLTIFATGFWTLFISTLLVGLANGMVEAACNPLVASIYPDKKTEKLNQFHVWFPAGIVIGGLIAFGLDILGANWQWKMATILIPTLLYGILFMNISFPKTERVTSGFSTKSMFKACGRPLFILMVCCMLLTAATELGTNQWINKLLSNVGIEPILLLVFISGLMALGRSFAGIIEQRLSPSGMLFFSAIFSTIGLYLLGTLTGYASFLAAGIFAVGICFFWPTMLGFVSEYIPKSGAMGLSIMGAAGMLSVAIILPFMGDLYDIQTQTHLPAGTTLQQFTNAAVGSTERETLKLAELAGGADTLKYIAILPFILSIVFGVLFMKRKQLNKHSGT